MIVSVPSVHPRACGEQLGSHLAFSRMGGSSPRVRGTGLEIPVRVVAERFIPARAGNRPQMSPDMGMHAVHPRACGEQGPE